MSATSWDALITAAAQAKRDLQFETAIKAYIDDKYYGDAGDSMPDTALLKIQATKQSERDAIY